MKGSNSMFNGYNSAESKDVKVVSNIEKTTAHSIPKTHISNSVVQKTINDKVTSERYFDKNGRAYLDIDYTNHGNEKSHPIVPHQHSITWIDGKFRREKGIKVIKK